MRSELIYECQRWSADACDNENKCKDFDKYHFAKPFIIPKKNYLTKKVKEMLLKMEPDNCSLRPCGTDFSIAAIMARRGHEKEREKHERRLTRRRASADSLLPLGEYPFGIRFLPAAILTNPPLNPIHNKKRKESPTVRLNSRRKKKAFAEYAPKRLGPSPPKKKTRGHLKEKNYSTGETFLNFLNLDLNVSLERKAHNRWPRH